MLENSPNYAIPLPNKTDEETDVADSLSSGLTIIDTELKNRKDELDTHKTASGAHDSVNIKHGDGNVRDTIFEVNSRLTTAETDIEEVDGRISTIVAQAGTDNTEIVDARGEFPVLKEHLDSLVTNVVSVTYNGVTTKFINQTTTLYTDIDSNIVNGNDGLSSDKPIKLSDIQTIFNELKVIFPTLLGTWTVQLAAGTYQSDGLNHMLYLADVKSANRITFKGPDVTPIGTVPTAILDGKINGTPYMHGMFFQSMNVQVKNIKVQNFTEGTTPSVPTGSRAGIAFSGPGGNILAYNVHTYNCSWGGLVNQGIPRLYVQGGKYEYCRYGILSMFNSTVTIGYNGDSALPDSQNVNVVNCTEAGLILQSQANGHADYCVFSGNTNKAMVIATGSEINAVNSKFTNNNVAISAQTNSRVLNTTCIFTNNTQDYELIYGGSVVLSANADANNKRRTVDQMIESSVHFTSTAPSGGGVVFSQLVPASSLFGRGKTLNFEVFGRFTNNNTTTSQILVKATDGTNTVTIQTISLPTTSAYKALNLEFYLSNYSKTVFYYNSKFGYEGTNTTPYNNVGLTLDSTKDITLTIEQVVTGTAADSTLNIYRILPRVAY